MYLKAEAKTETHTGGFYLYIAMKHTTKLLQKRSKMELLAVKIPSLGRHNSVLRLFILWYPAASNYATWNTSCATCPNYAAQTADGINYLIINARLNSAFSEIRS